MKEIKTLSLSPVGEFFFVKTFVETQMKEIDTLIPFMFKNVSVKNLVTKY